MDLSSLFGKKTNYFNKKIEPQCAYCQFGRRTKDDGRILCEKQGLMDETKSCNKFAYSPLKRIPVKQMNIEGALSDEEMYAEINEEELEEKAKAAKAAADAEAKAAEEAAKAEAAAKAQAEAEAAARAAEEAARAEAAAKAQAEAEAAAKAAEEAAAAAQAEAPKAEPENDLAAMLRAAEEAASSLEGMDLGLDDAPAEEPAPMPSFPSASDFLKDSMNQ